jgi:autotransporter-associated beta strand protein
MKTRYHVRRLLLASATLAVVNSAPAQLYWDTDGSTAGFGTASGIWGTDNFWNDDSTGGAGTFTTATTLTDALNFGTDSDGLATGTISLSGTVDSGNINFGAASGAITLSGGTINFAAASTITVNNTTNTISSTLTGAGTSLTKAGDGTLVLSAANSYSGQTLITAGTLRLSGAGTLGTGSVAVSSGALLDLNGTDQSVNFIGTGAGTVANNSGSGTSILTWTARPDLSSIVIADNTNSTNGKVAVVISVNTQTLNNSNTYSGGTTVNGGAFLYLVSSRPNGAGTGTINLTTAGTSGTGSGFLMDSGFSIANDITGAGFVHNNTNGAGTVTFTGNLNTSTIFGFRAGTGQVYNFAGNGTTSVLGGVIGANPGVNQSVITGSIIKSGTGTLTLSGPSIYTGTTTVSGGTLIIGANAPSGGAGALGNATSEVILGAAGGNVDASILSGGEFTIGRAIRLATTNTTDSGTRVLVLGGNTAHNSVFSGNITLGTNDQAGRGVTLTAADGGQVTFSGVIQDPTGMDATTYTVTKAGAGTVVLSNNNTYTGTTSVNEGILQIGNGVSAIAGALGGQSDTTIASGAVLSFNRFYDNNPANAYVYTGQLSGSGTFRVETTSRFDFNSNQSNGENLTYDVNGILAVRAGRTVEIGELTGSGSVVRGGPAVAGQTVIIGGKNTDSTFSGLLRADSNYQKVGTGQLTLTGASDYTGTTTVSAGTLALGATGSIANTPTITVATGATLDVSAVSGGWTLGSGQTLRGTGLVEGPSTVSGSIAPGNSGIGTLNANGNVTWHSGVAWQFDLSSSDTTADQLAITGDFVRGTGAAGSFLFDFMGSTPKWAETYTLITFDSTDFVLGDFDLAGSIATLGAGSYSTSFFTLNGNSLTFTAIPEPGTAFAGLLLTAGLLRRRRRD